MTRRPLIGITPTPSTSVFEHGTFYRFCLSDTYVKSVWRAGGNPVILPWVDGSSTDVLGSMDGLILSGGGDANPDLFSQAHHVSTTGIDNGRDEFEIALMRASAEHDVPTLAICRGIQVMGLAFGGVLHQHVPDVVEDALAHRQHTAGFTQHETSHRVVLDNIPNPVSQLLGKDELIVNSFHHQSLANVPAPLALAGRSEDGIIEAVWHPGMTFGIGLQWHPEMLTANYEDHAKFFEALVEASRKPAAIAG